MDRKIRLLYIVEAMGGGVFTYIVDLSNALADTFDITIAYATRDQTPENYKDYFDPRIHLIRVPHFQRAISAKNDIKAFFEIKEIAKEVQPDIIHLHSSKAGVLGRFAFDGHKIPLFYTPHGYSFLMSNLDSKRRKLYYEIERACAKRYCTTISCSKGEHEETLHLTKKAEYVNNGINVKELQKLLDTITVTRNDRFTVYTLGRINYQKNPSVFNEIALALPDVQFTWIGDGPLRDQITAPNIQITGWLDRPQALKIALQADAFLLTSLWEGLPISLLESMYMKKPCVVSDVIGNHDVIQNGRNGYVCNKVDDYINAVQEIRDEKAGSLIKNAYSDVQMEYNIRVMAERYRNIYYKAFKNKVENL